MKKWIGSCVSCLVAVWVSASVAAAQQAPPQQPGILEAFGCTFSGANDIGDFLGVAERWNDWADDRDVTDYTAFVLTPYLYSDELTYEVIWLGIWPNGAAMGEGVAQWLTEGEELNADFQEVSDCSMHQMAAAVPLRLPEGGPSETGLMSFSDCTLEEGHTAQQAIAALGQMAVYLEQNGNDLFHGVLFPLAGETSDASYDFKSVTGFGSHQAHGQFLDTALTQEALQTGARTLGGLMTCDSPRVYTTNLIRPGGGQ